MIVRCPSCSTGFHLGSGSSAGAVLRCSRCLVAFPCPAHRRTYALGPSSPAPRGPRRAPLAASFLEPVPAPMPVPMPAPIPEPMAARESIEEILFGRPPEAAEPAPEEAPLARPRRFSRTRRAHWEVEPAISAHRRRLLPLGLVALGAGGGWLAAPVLTDPRRPMGAWMASLPFPVETWMLTAAGAAVGLLLGGVWLGWRAARR